MIDENIVKEITSFMRDYYENNNVECPPYIIEEHFIKDEE